MDPAEPAVAEDNNDISVASLDHKPGDDGIGIEFVKGGHPFGAERLHKQVGVEPLTLGEAVGAGNGGETDAVGMTERFG